MCIWALLGPPLLTQSPRRRTQNWSGESEAEAGSTEQSAGEAGGEMMDSRRWQSPAAAAAAAEAAEEDTGGTGGGVGGRRSARRAARTFLCKQFLQNLLKIFPNSS